MAALEVPGGPQIPEVELTFTASRSGGPGGQHVNKVSTRITLVWDLAGSRSVSEEQRALLRRRLGKRVTDEGLVRLVVQTHRSQLANKEEARERLAELVARALAPRKRRRATAPTHGSREQRLAGKRRRGAIKRGRAPTGEEEG